MTPTAQRRLTGHLTVPLPPDQAFRLFTPRGEQDWVPHWQPYFPNPTAQDDDTAPSTVFQTHAHDQTTTWVVIDSTWGSHIRYARVIPATNAGTVTVTLTEGAAGHSNVTVTYELTALTEAATRHLDGFATGYPAFLQSWQGAIAASLHRPEGQRPRG